MRFNTKHFTMNIISCFTLIGYSSLVLAR